MTGGKSLSAKQERFAFALALGARPVDAYHAAGYRVAGLSDKGIAERSAGLAENPAIRGRLAELAQLVETTPIWSRTRAVGELLWLAGTAKREIREAGISTASANSFLNAVKELNRLEGADKPPEETGCGVVVLPQVMEAGGEASES